MTITVYADDTGYTGVTKNAKINRENEGQKNASDDVDFWLEINIDQSFAHQVRMATNYANRQLSVGNAIGGTDYFEQLDMSNVAPFFGYTEGEIETDVLDSPENTRTKLNSDSSITYNRDEFMSFSSSNSQSISYISEANKYAMYGLALSLMGFDEVGSSSTDATRSVYGMIALISYKAASLVNVLFEMAFDFLEATNPFMFFKDINIASNAGSAELNSIYDKTTSKIESTQGISELASYFGEIYNMFSEYAWAVSIPLSLIFIVIAFFLTRRGRYSIGSNLKKFIVRVVFLVIGIPLLGSAYTQVLDSLKDSQAMSDEYLAQAVSYTFLDFSAWVEHNRLAPEASGSNIRLVGNAVSNSSIPANTWLELREMCSNLNKTNGVFTNIEGNLTVSNDSGALLRDFIYDTSGNNSLSINAMGLSSSDYSNRENINSVLQRYMDGTKYTAVDFESGAISWMQRNQKSDEKTYGDMLALSCDKYSFSQKATRQVHSLQGKNKYFDITDPSKASEYGEVAKDRFIDKKDFGEVGYNIWTNGTITGSEMTNTGGTVDGYVPSEIKKGLIYSGSANNNSTSKDGYDCGKTVGFSTMAMYTYLTSEFTQTGVIVYGDAPSVYTQNSHYAVNLIGGDFVMKTVIFANMIAILLGYFIMAVFFVFRTAFDILFKGIQLMGHALFAAVGFYKSIGTCICMTINMVAQLFVTVIFFSFMVDLMFMVTSIMDHFASDALEQLIGNVSIFSDSYVGEVMIIMSSLLATFMIIFFVSFAIKWRAFIMSTLNSMVENIVGTLLGVTLTGASEGAMGNIAKSALSTATGVVTGAAGVAGGLAVTEGAKDMVGDLVADAFGEKNDDESEQGDDKNKSAADAAVNPTANAAFDGGSGANDFDEQTKKDGKKAIEEGLGTKENPDEVKEKGENAENAENADKTGTGDNASGSGDGNDLSDDVDKDSSNFSYHYGGTASQQAEMGISEDPVDILPRNDMSVGNIQADNLNVNGDQSGEDGDGEDGDRPDLTNSERFKSGLDARRKSSIFNKKLGDDEESDSKEENADNADNAENKDTGHNGKSGQTDKVNKTGEINANNTDDTSGIDNSGSDVETEEVEQGTEWQQIDNATGATSGISFDPSRGIVMTTVNDDGTVSDVAIGMNGISTSSVDDDGNKTVTNLSQDGVTTSYTGADGTTETTDVEFNGLESNAKITRTTADGDVEEITKGLDGTSYRHLETSADGSTRETVTDESGNTTISEHNATTGYESEEHISASGESVKTEKINGVTTVTATDSDGQITSQMVSKLDSNGQEVSSSHEILDDGSVVETSKSNGVTTSTVTTADGEKTETVTTVRVDGTSVETVTDYGKDEIADSVTTTVRSANGMEVLYESTSEAGSDENGNYNKVVTNTANGTTEVRTYDDGSVITTETAANGDKSITTANADGSYNIVETDASTGEVHTTNIDKNGKGTTTTTDANGKTIDTVDVPKTDDGGFSYTNITGGNISSYTEGSGNDKQTVTSQSYVSGGSVVANENVKSHDVVTTVTDGIGSETVTTYDSSEKTTNTSFTHANGNSGTSTIREDGSYTQNIQLAGGGTVNVERTVSGDDIIEHYSKTDSLGHQTTIDTENGKVMNMSSTSASRAAYNEVYDKVTGETRINQTLSNGDVVNSVAQADGDFNTEINHANGSRTVITQDDGNITYRNISNTGIETLATKTGSVSSVTTEYSGVTMSRTNDSVSGNLTDTFTTASGQSYSVERDSDGGEKIIFDMPNGTHVSSKTNSDGTKTNIIRQADGSSRVENITATGESSIVYMDTKGNTITDTNSITRLNDAYAESVSQFTSSMGNASNFINQTNAMPVFANTTIPDWNSVSLPTAASSGINLTGSYDINADNVSDSGTPDANVVTPELNLSNNPATVQSGILYGTPSTVSTASAGKTTKAKSVGSAAFNSFWSLLGFGSKEDDESSDGESTDEQPTTTDTTKGMYGRDDTTTGGSTTGTKKT